MESLRDIWVLALALAATALPLAALPTKAKKWMKVAAVGVAIVGLGASIYLIAYTGRDLTTTVVCSVPVLKKAPGCVEENVFKQTSVEIRKRPSTKKFDVGERWQLEASLTAVCDAPPGSDSADCDVTDLKWNPDGRSVAAALGDDTVRIWNLNNSNSQTTLKHSAPVHSIAWSPDGQRLATGDHHGVVRTWNIEESTSAPNQEMKTLGGAVHFISFSPDGLYLVNGSSFVTDGHVSLWNSFTGVQLLDLFDSADEAADVFWTSEGPVPRQHQWHRFEVVN